VRQEDALDEQVAVPLNRSSYRARVTAGAVSSALCVALILLPWLPSTRGDREGWAMFAGLVLLPLPLSVLASGIAIKRGWRPDLLFRALPLIVLVLMVAAFAWMSFW
jgi:hypothetical protein